MVSEDKIAIFLKLQQIVLDIEDETKLLENFLPMVLEQLAASGLSYQFLSTIFVDKDQQIKKTFFIEKQNQVKPTSGIINADSLLTKGNSWEMELVYGKPVVVSDIGKIVSSTYHNFSNIASLLIFPIQNIHKLSGVLILAAESKSDQIPQEDIEFIQMINKLIDLAYRLQDTEESLTKITQQVYEMNAKLHQLDKLKDDFVSVASHELRTPMTAIRSYTWMALHRADVPLSQKIEKYLYRTLISTERLINLVNDMLNVSRIESGIIEINPQSFDIVALVKDVFEEVKAKADEKRIQLIALEQPIPKVFADPDKVHEILLNLIGNSLKFCFPGGIITLSFFIDDEHAIEISVKDNGPGISKEDLGKLFHKFGRLDNAYTSISTSGGTGLGLYISKSLVELMHGKIWTQSEGLEKGATFTFSLPIATKDNLAHPEQFRIKVQGEAKGLEPVAI